MKLVAVFAFLTIAAALMSYGPFWLIVVAAPFAWLSFAHWVDRKL